MKIVLMQAVTAIRYVCACLQTSVMELGLTETRNDGFGRLSRSDSHSAKPAPMKKAIDVLNVTSGSSGTACSHAGPQGRCEH